MGSEALGFASLSPTYGFLIGLHRRLEKRRRLGWTGWSPTMHYSYWDVGWGYWKAVGI